MIGGRKACFLVSSSHGLNHTSHASSHIVNSMDMHSLKIFMWWHHMESRFRLETVSFLILNFYILLTYDELGPGLTLKMSRSNPECLGLTHELYTWFQLPLNTDLGRQCWGLRWLSFLPPATWIEFLTPRFGLAHPGCHGIPQLGCSVSFLLKYIHKCFARSAVVQSSQRLLWPLRCVCGTSPTHPSPLCRWISRALDVSLG